MASSKIPNGPTRIAVLGGGIIGMSSALRILDSFADYDIELTVLAAKFTPHTTSDGAAGFWNPYICGYDSEQRMERWCSQTFDYLLDLWINGEASKYGIGLLSSYQLSEKFIEDPFHKNIFIQWRDMTEKEHQMFPKKYQFGKFFTTLYAECSKLLPYMMERIRAKGGKILRRKINDLTELSNEYDVIINCPGVEAAQLVKDSDVQPIRGQTMRVKAPWIKHAIIADDFYILPNDDEVVCGGTHQEGDWNTVVDPKDRDFIWNGCCELLPSLKNATVVREWVGLRPGRSIPRLERETLGSTGTHKQLEVIHNYGHGGSGVTLFWGCAKEVVDNLREILNSPSLKNKNHSQHLQSRL